MNVDEVQAELERQLVPAHLYTKSETEEQIIYQLREGVTKEEFLPFIKEFYRIRYDEIGDTIVESEFYMEKISEFHNLSEWIKLAKKKEMEGFQISQEYNTLRIKQREYLEYYEETIILSLTGKVWMECYRGLFKFLIETIKLRFPQFKMKDTLTMFITD